MKIPCLIAGCQEISPNSYKRPFPNPKWICDTHYNMADADVLALHRRLRAQEYQGISEAENALSWALFDVICETAREKSEE